MHDQLPPGMTNVPDRAWTGKPWGQVACGGCCLILFVAMVVGGLLLLKEFGNCQGSMIDCPRQLLGF